MSYTRAGSQPWARWYFEGLLVLLLSGWTKAATIAYCSPDNDAGQNSISSNWMSNGACSDNCRGSYVFAVVLGQTCWCSNYVPASQVDASACSDTCPGYPDELCGNAAEGLYAYIDLGGTPLGTAGASSPEPQPSTTIPSTSAEPPSLSLSISTETVSVRASKSSSTTSSFFSSSAEQPTQVYTSTLLITGSGSVRTVVVTPTPAQNTDSALGDITSQSNGGNSGGLGGGTVAGIVVGVAIGIGLVIGGIVFLWLRKRHKKNLDAVSEGGSFAPPSHASKSNGGIPSRQVSQMSSAGLLTKPSRATTAGFSSGEDHRSNGPGTLSSDRTSTHITVDQRLNPWAIYSNEDSRASNVSLQDNHDYSRQLRVANPDP